MSLERTTIINMKEIETLVKKDSKVTHDKEIEPIKTTPKRVNEARKKTAL